MNKNNHDNASDTNDSAQSGLSSQHEYRPLTAREKDVTRKEIAVADKEADVLKREKSVTLRENAADQREGKMTASSDYMATLQQANAHLVISAIESHKQTERAEADKIQMEYVANHDVLTGLPNRMLLQDRLGQSIEIARREGSQFAVLFMDLDRFKDINDVFGHAVGDQLLQSVAQRLLSCVRQSDTVSRQGGDEFVLLLRAIKRAEDARLTGQKILTAFEQPHHIDGRDFNISLSIGISIYPDDAQDVETLINSADTAMFYAKEKGRNKYKLFEKDMSIRAVEEQSIKFSLRGALERQEFVLHYQPKINLQSGRIVGVEALIRWQHPEQGLLSPGQFMPIADECGLIQHIDRWVLREACNQTRSWQQAGLPPVTVSVNTSSKEFRTQDFLEKIHTTLVNTGLESRYLELEITESVLMHDINSTYSVLYALADRGVNIAVDNYGTGFSNLHYLNEFPINTLKIDQLFVHKMTSSQNHAAIVSSMITMAKNLKIRIIAKGVETLEEVAALQVEHCDEGQGYYFSHPVGTEALAKLLITGISRVPT
jgi:diguanylate cyclase (GGDEF)-like protein